MTYAAKGYFDALVKMGELASESQGSKELGKWPVYCRMETWPRAGSERRGGSGSRLLVGIPRPVWSWSCLARVVQVSLYC